MSAFSSDPDAAAEELRKKLAEKYNGDLPMKTERTPFKLIRDEGRWYVFMDFAVTKRVTEALAEAKKLQAEKKLDAALAKYDEVLAMKSDRADVRTAREDVEKARKQVAAELAAKAARRAYIKSIDLYDLRAKLHRTYSGRIPGVDFKLKNNGDKTLNRVEVTVFFKDASGAVIHEEKYNPVLVSEFSFDRASNKPLKPNYVWQNRRGYFLKAESTPSERKVGDVDAAVTDLEFAD